MTAHPAVRSIILTIKATLLARIPPSIRPMLHFTAARTPSLVDLAGIAHLFPATTSEAICKPPPATTAFEQARGNAVVFHWHEGAPSAQALADAFSTLVLPAAWAPDTRKRYWTAWKSFVSFALSVGMEGSILTGYSVLLRSWCFHHLNLQYSTSYIAIALAAITHRYTHLALPSPFRKGEAKQWLDAFASNAGVSRRVEILPVLPSDVVLLSRTLPASLLDLRDRCILGLGTLLGARPSALSQMDVCDIWWRYDTTRPERTAAFNIKTDKTDRRRKGHLPRVGTPKHNSSADVLGWIITYMESIGLFVHPSCQKRRIPTATCNLCGKLFRSYDSKRGCFRATVNAHHGLTRSAISSAVKRIMSSLGGDPDLYSAKSMRRGLLSAAAAAQIPEYLIAMQSGHSLGKSGPSARHYMHLGDTPNALFAVYGAFGF